MKHLNLIAIIGSLRAESVNGAIARATVDFESPTVTVRIHDIAAVPLYNGDIEAVGLPDAVADLHEAVGACDGLIFCSPEYNGSFPAVTKNVIDWLSRPPRSWEDTPVTMITASPGPRAGAGVRTHFSEIMERQPVRVFDTHGIGRYGDKLDENGELAEPETRAELDAFLASFVAFCAGESGR